MGDVLKEIIAVVRPEKWRATQTAIFAAGVTGASQNRILGRGRQAGLRYLSRIRTGDGPVTMGYLPKRMVSCIVREEQVSAVVEGILQANRTGNHGDGKVFVCPVEESVRVRTGERGAASVEK
ncbi:MAG: P-II family nitrogen regulator [Elusimicrobiota bacterium]|jgi:nitrogen regulatory protein PII 2